MRVFAVCVLLLATSFALTDQPKNAEQEKASIDRAKRDLNTLTAACVAYKLRYGNYPEKLDQLVKPPNGNPPFLKPADILKDPWEKCYEYDAAGKHHKNNLKPDIWTKLPSGEVLGNWPEEKKDKK